jgi:sn-glycerol 3-phosphate transport system ATP-binding protein
MVFQNYALYPHMTVFDNIAYGMKLSKIPKEEIERRVSEVATMLNISQFLQRKPHELSGGQRQRIAIGRAIVREPTIMLFDEPLSNLDATLRGAMRIELRKLHDRTGATSVFVTHDQVEAMTLADRILIMNKGVIEQIGTPREIYHTPQSTFVAGFIGSPAMNLITTTEAYTSNEIGNFVSLLDNPQNIGTIGIRPEHVNISSERSEPTDIKCAIDLIEDLGANKLVYCKFGACQITVSTAASCSLSVGDVAYLSMDFTKINLFDKSGKRIDSVVKEK